MKSWLSESYFRRSKPACQVQDAVKLRVEEAMQKLTEENFILASRLLQHGMLLAVIMYACMGAPCFTVLCFGFYAAFMLIAKGYVHMTAARVKLYILFNYVTFVPVMFAGDIFAALGSRAVLDEIVMAYRFVLVVQCVDSNLHVPCQFAVSLCEVAFYLQTREWGEAAVPYIFGQAFTAAMTSTLSAVLEYYLRQRLVAQFRTSDAESITSGFRRMLRGVCDGEVLLNSNLSIQGSSHCLNRLLSTHEELHGRRFQDLLLQDEQEQRRFQDFITRSVSEDTPGCLRVSLSQTSATRIGVDLYHVALPHLYGSDEIYHLLAFKEDAVQPLPEVTHNLPEHLLPGSSNFLRSVSHGAGSKRRSAASAASEEIPGALWSSLRQISDIVLLIDPTTSQKEIRQAHLNFKRERRSNEEDIPSLRRLARPTDWESIRAAVSKYAHKAGQSSVDPKFLPPMWIRRLDKPNKYMLARQPKLYFSGTHGSTGNDRSKASRLWLALSGLSLAEKTHEAAPSELHSIGEHSEMSESDA
ncbi:ISA3 [Symbiodinium pilosum]|uniref:ISA3 protein n=1 Tax=Symbiodinium pilosum TaxID=2952 RepID=A0A812IYE1_SYMPI|nr:ISA3 [Symbiodinium pilosum]